MGSRHRSCPEPLSPERCQPGLQLRAARPSASPARCAQVLADPAVQPSAATFVGLWQGVRGASLERNQCVRVSAPSLWLLPLFPGRLRLPGQGRGQVLACASPPSCPAPGPRFRRPGADGRRPARLPAPGRVCSDGRGSQSQGGRGKPARAPALRPAPGRPTLRLKTSRSSSLRSRRSGSSPPPSEPRSPNLNSPPAEPGVQAPVLLSRPYASSFRLRVLGPQPFSLRPRIPQSCSLKTKIADPSPTPSDPEFGLISPSSCPQVFVTWSWWC